MVQTPAAQPGVPFASEQVRRQALQFFGSVWRFTSQPLAGLASQSAKPVVQVPVAQLPLVQTGALFSTVQTLVQRPQ